MLSTEREVKYGEQYYASVHRFSMNYFILELLIVDNQSYLTLFSEEGESKLGKNIKCNRIKKASNDAGLSLSELFF